MGRSQKAKGARGEREAAELLRVRFPDAERDARQAGHKQRPDVDGTPFWVEVKVHAAISAIRFLEQAEAQTDGRPPVVLMRESRRGRANRWVVLMGVETFLGLLRPSRRPSSAPWGSREPQG